MIDYTDVVLETELGKGAFGTVYKGEWRSQEVAMKIISSDSISAEQTEEFLHEVALMMELRPHKNCVQMLGFVREPLAIVMDFVSNGTVENFVLSRQEMSLAVAVRMLDGVAAGMLHLHAEKIVHRDLAARNILLTETMEAVIADYGMSRQVTDEGVGKTQTAVGPLKWMALECLQKKEYSPASDVWAFGIVCWEVFARSPPYPDLDGVQVVYAVRDGVRPIIPEYVPPAIAFVMGQCWDPNPAQRPTMKDLSRVFAHEKKQLL